MPTAGYNGPELFVSLTKPWHATTSDTANAITTKFSKEHSLRGFTAHSTQGAAVTALAPLGCRSPCGLCPWWLEGL